MIAGRDRARARAAGRRPADRPRPGLLHRHRLRDPAGRARVATARSAPAAATTPWPPTGRTTYPGVGISIGVSRLLGRLVGPQGLLRPAAPTPTCVLVAAHRRGGPRRRRMRVAAALRRRGIPVEVAPAAAKFGKQIRYAERRGIPFVWFPGARGDAATRSRTSAAATRSTPTRRRGAAGGRPAPARRRRGGGRGDGAGDRAGGSGRRGLSRRRPQAAVAQLEQRQRADDVRVLRPPRSGRVVATRASRCIGWRPGLAARTGRGRRRRR